MAMDDKNRIREVFEGAEAGLRPEIGRVSARVPALIAEARRRRSADTRDFWVPLIAMARRAVPRLALATGFTLVAAVALHLTTDATPAQTTASSGVESLILSGEGADTDDPLLQWIASLENGNG